MDLLFILVTLFLG